jgi:hypothetical protein
MARTRPHHLQPVFRHDQVDCGAINRASYTGAVTVYAGAGKSGIYIDGEWKTVEGEQIKKAVKERTIRLIVATDAACEGLNLQTPAVRPQLRTGPPRSPAPDVAPRVSKGPRGYRSGGSLA